MLAGGHSLIPAMKLRLAQPKVVVDIGRIANLSYIREAAGRLAIGAMTTHGELEPSGSLATVPALAEDRRAHRRRPGAEPGTIGGSLAHADPAADYPAAILALEAEMEVVGPRGRRTVGAAFFVGPAADGDRA